MNNNLNVLTNSLHGTSFRSHKTNEELDAIELKAGGKNGLNTLTGAETTTVYRIRNKLCPDWKNGCKCGDFWRRK